MEGDGHFIGAGRAGSVRHRPAEGVSCARISRKSGSRTAGAAKSATRAALDAPHAGADAGRVGRERNLSLATGGVVGLVGAGGGGCWNGRVGLQFMHTHVHRRPERPCVSKKVGRGCACVIAKIQNRRASGKVKIARRRGRGGGVKGGDKGWVVRVGSVGDAVEVARAGGVEVLEEAVCDDGCGSVVVHGRNG